MASFYVKDLTPSEFPAWDKFLAEVPYSTIFHSSTWLSIARKHFNRDLIIAGCFRDEELVGGYALFVSNILRVIRTASSVCPLTPMSGLVISEKIQGQKMKEHHTSTIIAELCKDIRNKKFFSVSITNSPGFSDMRPFIWSGWDTRIMYTYILNLVTMAPSRNIEREIKRARNLGISVEISQDVKGYYDLLVDTLNRDNLKLPVNVEYFKEIFLEFSRDKKIELWMAKDRDNNLLAGEIFLFDTHIIHRWSAASDPALRKSGATSFLLWNAFEDFRSRGFRSANLMTANTPSLLEYTRKLNPDLVPYYVAEKTKFALRLACHP